MVGGTNLSFGLRTVDGSFNNLLPGRSDWGAADQPFLELVDPKFLPGYQPGANVSDSQPRTISNLVVDMSANNPAAVQAALAYHEIDGALANSIYALSDALGAANVTSVVLARGESVANTALGAANALATAATALAAALADGELSPAEDGLVQAAVDAASANATAAHAVVALLATNGGVPGADTAAAASQAAAADQLVLDLGALQTALGDGVDQIDIDASNAAATSATSHAGAAATLVLQLGQSSETVKGAALTALNDALDDAGIEVTEGGSLVIPNVATDEGLSAPFNSWMTLFGQFFDHGLDLVNKGGDGTVIVPLQQDDPLYDPGPDGVAGTLDDGRTNFMVLTRANRDGPDGQPNTADDGDPVNATSPFVDQNQTYSSHASHQVFLREYELDEAGRPIPTGKLIQGRGADGQLGTSDDRGMATWADIKEQALTKLGIVLTDADVTRVPHVLTDLYGNFTPAASGFPQLITPGGTVSGTPTSPVAAAGAIATGHAFLDDIAHNAVPGTFFDPDGPGVGSGDILVQADNDNVAGNFIGTDFRGRKVAYDDELLDAHFVAGDGRVNENIGLTAVHQVFHSEHNRLVELSKNVILGQLTDPEFDLTAQERVAFLNEWLRVDVDPATDPATINPATLEWDGARLFQAAKFGTEMQYQHLVFEDFARKIQPQIDVFIAPVGYDVSINPAIFAEFAHTVYRFGHSMLTETVDRYNTTFDVIGEGWEAASPDQIGLIEAFLNPLEFDNEGAIDPDVAAGAVVRGMTRQVGNHIDEFVTDALRSNLLDLPLDLATINLARGRDTGVPTLNEARAEFFAMTGDSQLTPYESWLDFTLNLKNQTSVVNFIAAYGTHASITGATSVAEKRDAAMKLVFGDESLTGAELEAFEADRLAFLNAEGAYTNKGGLNNIDLWIGGLAEKTMAFGGMLGSTFNFVFETQLENLQNGDRFYYLARTAGTNFIAELEQNSFASLVIENTDTKHLPIDVFSTPAYILEVDRSQQFTGLGPNGNADPTQPGLIPLVQRANANSLRYNGEDHVVLGGNDNNNTLTASIGDYAIWGDGGNDRIEGGFGNDNIDGGAGDDIITDSGGDDVIKGNAGNDVISGGPGIDLIIGGTGHDFLIAGEDISEMFAGDGNDFLLGSTTSEAPTGGTGDDWFEGGTQDGANGDEAHPFGADNVAGHDVFFGEGGFDEYVGEGGDDIMFGSPGQNRNEGGSGFDWVSYILMPQVNADLNFQFVDGEPIPPGNFTEDRFAFVEGMSGSHGNDLLLGSDVTAAEMPTEGARGSVLTGAGMDRIAGLRALLENSTLTNGGVQVLTPDGTFDGGNIILGGGGADIIEGRAGDDVIDGDKYLTARISVVNNSGVEIASYDSMNGRPTGQPSGPTLKAAMLAGTYNPGQLRIVREIKSTNGTGIADTARYAGNFADYSIQVLAGNVLVVTDNTGLEGRDILYGIERVQFANQVFVNSQAPVGSPTISDTSPTEGRPLTATTNGITDGDGIPAGTVFTFQWQQSANGTTWTNIAGATAATFTPAQAQVGQLLRVLATYVDGSGDTETVPSVATTVVGDLITGNANNNNLVGNGGDDRILGLAGNDTLTGNAGADTLEGGLGNDTFVIDDLDTIVELAGQGTDTVTAPFTTIDLTEARFANIENATFNGAGAFTGLGTAAANRLQGGTGNDSLDGRGGVDTMVGGLGDDTYFIDNANDVVTEAAGQGIDHVFISASDTLGNNVENMTLAATANGINGTGNGLANAITGNNSGNLLNGAGGNDTVFGEGGADNLIGGGGNDDLRGHGGNDTLTGDGGNDILRGGGGNDNLNGGAGNDTLIGGAGNDAMNGNGGNDVFQFVASEGFGNDTTAGFDFNPTGGQDLIDLSALGIVEDAFGTLVRVSNGGGGNAIIEVDQLDGNGDPVISQITLTGVNNALVNITEADFIFA